RLRDQYGNDLVSGGDSVTLSTTHGSLGIVQDNGDGTYSATLSATTPGTATVSGHVNSVLIADDATVDFAVGAASAATSVITASPTSTTVDHTSAITVRLRDQYGNDLVSGGDSVTLSTTHGSLGIVQDNGDGTYSATLSATTPGTATVSGHVNSVLIADDATVDFAVGAASAATSVITASPTSTTVDHTSAITVRLRDQYGNDLVSGGDSVTLSTTHGSLGIVQDNGDGTYSATLSATTPGTATVSGHVNSVLIADDATVDFAVGAASAATSVITASPTSTTVDHTSAITVRLRDQYGNDLVSGGDSVTLSTTHGSLGIVQDNGDGTYSATLSATTPGTATVSGHVNSVLIADDATVDFAVGAASAATSVITASPTSTTVDHTSAITVRLRDQYGNDLVSGGDSVTLSTTHGSLGIVQDNGDGTYSATLSATTPGTATVSGHVNSVLIADDATVDFAVGAASAATSVITASPTSTTVDHTSAITVRLRDQYGNDLVSGGDSVTLSTTHGSLGIVQD